MSHPVRRRMCLMGAQMRNEKNKKNRRSDESSAEERRLHPVLANVPTTASSAWFCLLCCQPEPIPRSLSARMSQFTLWDPCRLLAWSGLAINTVCSTSSLPSHFIALFPKATGEVSLPASNMQMRKLLRLGIHAQQRRSVSQCERNTHYPKCNPRPDHPPAKQFVRGGRSKVAACLSKRGGNR